MSDGLRYPHLPRAPIVEAIIDWRAKLAPGFDVLKLKEAAHALSPKYSFVDEQRLFQFKFKYASKQSLGTDPQQTSQDLGIQGYRFRSGDKLEIAVLKPTGFSFSRLKPYTNWDSVFGEAQRIWQIYRSVARPEEVTRIAVRYINRIGLSMPVGDFSRYLIKPFELPKEIPQLMTSALYRVVVHDPQSGISTNITQVIEGHPESGTLPFILDIDAYIAKPMNPNVDNFAASFAPLREMKNRVFFGTLTDETISMFR